jgi:O-antigen/teichoic acid export membrane protein
MLTEGDNRPNAQGRLARHLSDPLFRTGYLLTAGTGITAILGLIFWVLAARSYAPHVIGVNSAAISAMLFVASVCQLGLPAVLVRDLPKAGGRTRRVIVRSYVFMFVAGLLLGAVAALSSRLWSGSLAFLHRDAEWLIGFSLATAFYVIFLAQDLVMTGLKAPGWVPIENSLFSVAKVLLLLVAVGAAPLAGPFIAWTVPAAIAVVAITVLIFRKLVPSRVDGDPAAPFDMHRFVGMSASNQLALLFTYATTLLMPVIVAAATNASSTAYFYVPWSIAAGLGVFAVNNSLSLTVESALGEPGLMQLARRTLMQTLRMTIPVAIVVVILAPEILHLYGARYAAHGTGLLRLLAVATIPNAFYTIGEALLRIRHQPVALVLTQAGQCLLFLALSLVLIHREGIAGVGLAFIVAQTTVGAGLLFSVMRGIASA